MRLESLRVGNRPVTRIKPARTSQPNLVHASSLTRTRSGLSPVAATATPVASAAEQQHDDDDNQNQFHGKLPFRLIAVGTLY